MLSVSQVIETLLVTNSKTMDESEVICECSLGKLHYNVVTNQKYETEKQCSKKAVCYFIAVEKHKARISTKEFLRHQKFKQEQELKEQNQKTKNSLHGNIQTSLLEYLQLLKLYDYFF